MSSPAPASAPRGFRQARCTGCGLTAETCVCGLFARLPNGAVSVSVVMSPAEARSASNSGRLLALWLPEVELHVRGGERPGAGPELLLSRPDTALLFPGGGRAVPLPQRVRHLIIPDGTWAQARRIERRWFARHDVPRLQLEGPWPSLYELRRRHGGICTFEAAAIALGALGELALAEALLGRFVHWAERARWLKAGGSGRRSRELPEHPALRLLRALPRGSADAARASAAFGGSSGLDSPPAAAAHVQPEPTADREQSGEHR